MQLFSIGLIKLNMDGSPVLDSFGNPIKTYDSKDIVSFARAWTGFVEAPFRGNVEDRSSLVRTSLLDPMRIQDIRSRDLFPKRGLDGKYIGDRYPLCEDLPEKAFLRKGAKYKLLGGDATPKWQQHNDDIDWNDPKTKHVVLDPDSSNLYAALDCQESGLSCEYSPVIVLDDNLACVGIECDIDTVRVVQVGAGIFYEYIQVPCVKMTFYEDAKKLRAGSGWWNMLNMCGKLLELELFSHSIDLLIRGFSLLL